MTIIECVEELMADEAFEACIYTENGTAYWDLAHLYDALLYADPEDDEYEYETSSTGHIHRLKDDGELGRKVYRNLGDKVKFFTKLAKDEVKESGAEVDDALLRRLSEEVEIDIDDETIESVLKKYRPRKKK